MAKEKTTEPTKEETIKKCGIVMPIAGFDGYSADHWMDVKEIISQASEKAGFAPNLVSYTDETSVIHKTIIQNLYDNEIVVVDVSGKNPNVMFELGIRLTFDKPTIIIKDDKTNYIFDTGIIDHLVYPCDLHYQSIIKFKEHLTKKIKATYDKSLSDNYSSFLKNFGEFTVSKLEKKEVPEFEFILKAIGDLRADLKGIKSLQKQKQVRFNKDTDIAILQLWELFMNELGKMTDYTGVIIKDFEYFKDWTRQNYTDQHYSLGIYKMTPEDLHMILLDFIEV